MLHVEDLEKTYGSRRALAGISFGAERGEVVGLLGPNGAGKTTAMRILTGFLAPTRGRAQVDGYDSFSQSLAVRQRTGYLPEAAPIYPDLRVDEHLGYRARLKGVGRRARKGEVARVLDRVFLREARTRRLGTLSRGERQRVGLADALLGSPALLVLDEPTAGLDPNQLRRVRELLASLAPEQTVLISTHILGEVEATCDRAVIIHRGRIAAETPVKTLDADPAFAVEIEAIGAAEKIEAALSALGPVGRIESRALGGGATRFTVHRADAQGGDLREACGRALLKLGVCLRELRGRARRLEDIFAEATREDPA